MDLQAVREAVDTRLATITTTRTFPFPPDQVPAGNATVIVITPADVYVSYQEAFAKGLAVIRLVISPWIPYADPRSAFNRLDELLSSGTGETRSIIDKLMDTDRTLSGAIGDVVLESVTGVRVVQSPDNVRYLTADLNVRILTGRR